MLKELLGRGGMGAVFCGHDGSLDRPVAIKLLGAATSARRADRRFLEEGRALARVVHEGCVRVFDCGVDPTHGPFLVMERLEGEDLSAFLARRGPLPVSLALSLAEQVCSAVQAVHDAGIVHRDLKPGNIFLVRHGPDSWPRIKLLDFGIARLAGAGVTEPEPAADADGGAMHPKDRRGTVAYMAPERWLSEDEVDTRSDVYAVGAILHEMLSGVAPFRADTRAALRLAVLNDPAESLHERRPDLPAWLVVAVERALRKSPRERPQSASDLAEVLRAGITGASTPGVSVPGEPGAAESPAETEARGPRQTRTPDTFVGRQETLESLEGVMRGLRGAPRIVLVEGPSGIGKSALLEHFRLRLESHARVLVLSGRAREGESIPYPALDEVIEELGSHLTRLPPAVAAALLPRRCHPLAQLFPTLARVPALAQAVMDGGRAVGDAAQARRHACEILRALFSRLCAQMTVVVLLIDDLQWIDADSAMLLGELLGGYDPPPLLLIGAVRANDGDVGSPALERLRVGLSHAIERSRLGPLTPADARALVLACWASDAPPDSRTVARLARQSGGVPFFVVLLAGGSGQREHAPLRLEDFLIERQQDLPPDARAALELICVSSRPLPVRLVLAALGIEDVRTLDALFTSSLVRWTKFHNRWAVEPYHSKIRETVRGRMTSAADQRHHRALAQQLRADPLVDPEVLVEHLAGGGDGEGATEVALKAARLANEQLAFDRAAALFAIAARCGQHDDEEQLTICRWQVEALQNAGRRRGAGELLLGGLRHSRDPAVTRRLQVEAGAHLLLSGDIERGLEVLAPALERAGLRVPASFAETVEVTTVALTALAARGLAAGPPNQTSANDDALARVDLCLLLAQGLAHIDLRVVPFACHALHAALNAGEPDRLQRACALFVINTVEYVPNALVAPVLGLCRRLTATNPRPLATALLETAAAENAHFEGDFLAAEAAFERAERTLLQSCPGATRELATVRDLAVFIQYAQKGDFRTQVPRTQRWLAQAEAARDVFHASMLRVAHAIVWIAHDDPVRARSELDRAQAGWKGDAGVLGVAVALYRDIIDRYEETDLTAEDEHPMRSALLRSPAAQTPFLGGYLVLQDVWVSLRALAVGRVGHLQAARLRDSVDGLRRLGPRLWSAVADALESNLDYLEEEGERGVRLLGQAEEAFRRLHMLCLAACARKRRGQFAGGEVGRRLEEEADAELHSLGVANPERWTRAYWSMFDVAAVQLRTDEGDDRDDAAVTATPLRGRS